MTGRQTLSSLRAKLAHSWLWSMTSWPRSSVRWASVGCFTFKQFMCVWTHRSTSCSSLAPSQTLCTCRSSGFTLWYILNNSFDIHCGLIHLSYQLRLLQDLRHRETVRSLHLRQVLAGHHLLLQRAVARLDHHSHDAAGTEAGRGVSLWVCGFLGTWGVWGVIGLVCDQQSFCCFACLALTRTSIRILHYHVPQFPLPRVVVLSAFVDLNVSPQMCLEEKCRDVRVGGAQRSKRASSHGDVSQAKQLTLSCLEESSQRSTLIVHLNCSSPSGFLDKTR